MNWHFRTIGMGSINYRAAASRLARDAYATGLFESSIGSCERDMKRLCPQFWSDHSNVLHARTPGFGWWVWKPYFILQSLLTLPEGDGLLYLDAGSIIQTDAKSVETIARYMDITEKQKITGSNSDFYSEQLYTCNDLLNYLNLSPTQRSESQFCAAILFVINDSEGRAFIEEWCTMVCIDDHNWLLPVKLETENYPGFVHHMHDQATLSCLLKSKLKASVPTGNKTTAGAIRLARHRFAYSPTERNVAKIWFYKALNHLNRIWLALQRRIHRNSLTIRPRSHQLVVPKILEKPDV